MTTTLPETCRACDEHLVGLAFGEKGDVPAPCHDHLAGCDRCQGVLAELESTRRVMGSLPLEEPSSEMDDRIFKALDAHLAGSDVTSHLRLPEPEVAAPARPMALVPALASDAAAPARSAAPAAAPTIRSLPTRSRRRWAMPAGFAAAATLAVLVGGTYLSGGRNYSTNAPVATAAVGTAPVGMAPAAPAPAPVPPPAVATLEKDGAAGDSATTVSIPALGVPRTEAQIDDATRTQALEASRAEAQQMMQKAIAIAPTEGAKDGLREAAGLVDGPAAGAPSAPVALNAPPAAPAQPVAAPAPVEAVPEPVKVAEVPKITEEKAKAPEAMPAEERTELKKVAMAEPVAHRRDLVADTPSVPKAPAMAMKEEAPAPPPAPSPDVQAKPAAPVASRAAAPMAMPLKLSALPPADALNKADAGGIAAFGAVGSGGAAAGRASDKNVEAPWEPLQRQLADAKARSDWKTVAAIGDKLALMAKAPNDVRSAALADRVRALFALGDERGAKASGAELSRRWGLPGDLAGRLGKPAAAKSSADSEAQ